MVPEGPNIFKEVDVVLNLPQRGKTKESIFVSSGLCGKKQRLEISSEPLTYNNKHILIFF
jgi:hypothetical protein